MNQVAVDENDRGFAGFFMDDVSVPNFLVERFGCHGNVISVRCNFSIADIYVQSDRLA